jgi:hypothetical protein
MSVARQKQAPGGTDERDGGSDGGDGGDGLSRETAFEVLSCTRRRYVLHHLLGEDGNATLRELTMRVAAWENGVSIEKVTSKQRMRVYTALRQSHLPKMDREGVVEFDAASGDVELSESAEDLEVYLDVVPGNEIPWSEYYLGLGALGVALTAAVWVDAFPFGVVPDVTWIGVVSMALVASATAHTVRNRRMKLGAGGEPPA